MQSAEPLTDLVERARRGDVEAFGCIVTRYQDMAVAYAYTRLGRFHDAEDAAQDAFIDAYVKLASLREPGAFLPWPRAVIRTRCQRLDRRATGVRAGDGSGADSPDAGPGPGEAAEDRQLAATVDAAIGRLPEPERVVTTLFYMGGHSQREIGAFVGVPVATVKNRLRAGRARLRAGLADIARDYVFERRPSRSAAFREHTMDVLREYQSPLTERYASPEMSELFSPHFRYTTYRQLWVALAESEQELGLDISDEQIAEMREHVGNIDYEYVARKEREIRHDVMAHIHAYGEVAPKARAIIHLGATSAYVGDNTDLIQMRAGLRLLRSGLLNVIAGLADFARRTRDIPTLGFTHFQPAQPTTVGKRTCLWIQEFLLDWEDINFRLGRLAFRGVKGTTGTQASFLELFDNDAGSVDRLDDLVTEKMGFDRVFAVTGQTYPRKVDAQVGNVLAGIAQSAHKFSNDIRLLQQLKEVEEPFGSAQVGSSAMPYKQNPMRSERIASLARYVMTTAQSPYFTAATQWFERTLDDSANKRISVPEMFLATDAILILAQNVARGLVVHEKMARRRLMEELPFMAAETILMEAVKRGGDRQDLHERIRGHSLLAGSRVKDDGLDNDLMERIASDDAFGLDAEALATMLDPARFVGRAPDQVVKFLNRDVQPILDAHADLLGRDASLRV